MPWFFRSGEDSEILLSRANWENTWLPAGLLFAHLMEPLPSPSDLSTLALLSHLATSRNLYMRSYDFEGTPVYHIRSAQMVERMLANICPSILFKRRLKT